MHRVNTVAGRCRALREADAELHIEGLHRDPATAVILEAWVDGELTGANAIICLSAISRARRASADAPSQEK